MTQTQIQWMTGDEAAAYTKYARQTIRRAATTGELRATKRGRSWVYRLDWLDAWMEAGCQTSSQRAPKRRPKPVTERTH